MNSGVTQQRHWSGAIRTGRLPQNSDHCVHTNL
jgi:hypothetical protein